MLSRLMVIFVLLGVLLSVTACYDVDPLGKEEHLGPGTVRTVEYYTYSMSEKTRLVVETQDHLLLEYNICRHIRLPVWQGLELVDFVFRWNRRDECTEVVAFKK